MKGKEIIDSIVRNEMPDTETVRVNCISQDKPVAPQRKRAVFRAAVSLAAVAAVALALFLGPLFRTPHGGNSFSLTAYALEEKADGTVVYHEFSGFSIQEDEQNGQVIWCGNSNGLSWHGIRILLECEGENIEKIEFSADGDAGFKLMDFKIENGEIVPDKSLNDELGISDEYFIAHMERMGRTLTLSADELDSNLAYGVLLIKFFRDPENPPPFRATLHAVATFHDGSTQEITLVSG